jgi:hypothetical protein
MQGAAERRSVAEFPVAGQGSRRTSLDEKIARFSRFPQDS